MPLREGAREQRPEHGRRQPLRPFWGPLLRRSDYHGIAVFHAAMPAKSPSVAGRILGWIGFHVVSTIAGLVMRSFAVRATAKIRAVDPTPAVYAWKVAIPPETTLIARQIIDEVADFPMMRRCLLGIKRRAEATTLAA